MEAAACPHCGAAAPAREKTKAWVPCQKCGSANTKKVGPGLLGFIFFFTGSCFIWIPIIGWVLAPFCFLAAVVFWVFALIPSGRISFQCNECKGWFTVRKNELPG
jgi:hypothetical protein